MTDHGGRTAAEETEETHAPLEDAHGAALVSWDAVKQFLANPAARRGLLNVVIGLAVLASPAAGGFVLVVIVAIGLIVSGLSSVVSAIRTKTSWIDWTKAIVSIAAGASIFILGEDSLRLIALGLALMFAIRGSLDILGVIRSRRHGTERIWPLIRGTGQIVIGAIVAVSPTSVITLIVVALAASWLFAGLLILSNVISTGSEGAAGVTKDATVTTINWFTSRDMGVSARQQVVDKLIFEGSAATAHVMRFAALMLFATAIATFGVQADSTAVVIGAMLIAPLMTPIMATSASLLMGWPVRALRSILLVALGVVLAIGISWVLTKFAPDIVAVGVNSQVLSRVSPTLLDLLVAIAAGAAGAYATSRVDVSDSLPGVAIAVALVPPLSVVGISLSAGELAFAGGAFLLFLTNLVGIILSAGVVFVLVGFSPWFQLEAKRENVLQSFAVVGIALLIIAIPLGFTGNRIVVAAVDQRTAVDVVDTWLDDSQFAVADVTVDGDEVSVTIVGSDPDPEAADLAADLARELNRSVDLDLRIIPEQRIVINAVP